MQHTANQRTDSRTNNRIERPCIQNARNRKITIVRDMFPIGKNQEGQEDGETLSNIKRLGYTVTGKF